ncbi:MAG: DUF1501 domain-containing protein, partial [Pirellula sp.]
GAWVHYGLGTLNENLPQFISMGNREYWNKKDGHYLGPAHDAVPMRIDPNAPLDFGKPERALDPQAQQIGAEIQRCIRIDTHGDCIVGWAQVVSIFLVPVFAVP